MKYFILISTLSIVFPISFSRIVTTFDPPGEFSVPIYDENNQLIHDYKFDTKEGINIAYEHMITRGGIVGGVDFYLFGGGEFMIGRRSDVNISLHSLYLKPIIGLTDKLMLNFSLGLTVLNTEQKDFILDAGSLLSMGIEYGITDNLSLAITKSYYNLFEKAYPASSDVHAGPFFGSNVGETVDLESTTLDMRYEKIGFSVIYGFKTN